MCHTTRLSCYCCTLNIIFVRWSITGMGSVGTLSSTRFSPFSRLSRIHDANSLTLALYPSDVSRARPHSLALQNMMRTATSFLLPSRAFANAVRLSSHGRLTTADRVDDASCVWTIVRIQTTSHYAILLLLYTLILSTHSVTCFFCLLPCSSTDRLPLGK